MAPATVRLTIQIALVVGAYYLSPIGEAISGALLWVRVVGALAAIVALGIVIWRISRGIAREVRGPKGGVQVEDLVLAIVIGVAVFALADLILATIAPGQFVGLETKTDALYFALTTLTTIGFGDVSAEGQLARGLVIVQMLFNVIVLTAAARTAIRAVTRERV